MRAGRPFDIEGPAVDLPQMFACNVKNIIRYKKERPEGFGVSAERCSGRQGCGRLGGATILTAGKCNANGRLGALWRIAARHMDT